MTDIITEDEDNGTYEYEYGFDRPTSNNIGLRFIFKNGHHEVKEEVKLLKQ